MTSIGRTTNLHVVQKSSLSLALVHHLLGFPFGCAVISLNLCGDELGPELGLCAAQAEIGRNWSDATMIRWTGRGL